MKSPSGKSDHDREGALLNAALELAAGERAAFLDLACANNLALRQRLENLLSAHDQAGTFLANAALPAEGAAMLLATVSGPAATALATVSEKPGDRIGRYKLLEKIGEGGMGVVYMAEQQEPVVRKVALKIIKLGMDTAQVVARFEAERQALALMDHPNIARVLDGGATDTGRPYFVMELVQGVPITEFCDKNQFSTEERLKLFLPVCQAIQSAHQKGIIHRDLKPTNILVARNPDGSGMPKVIDFGVAKATHQKLTQKTLFTHYGAMIGTPAYMSPEQAELSHLDVDTRSDIYGLGVLLYELLTGTTPFPEKRLRSAGYHEMQRIILHEEPERPSTRLSTMQGEQRSVVARNRGAEELALGRALADDLDWIVMKCLEKDRARRYETANGLARDLERHLNLEPVVARPPSAAYRLQKACRRHKAAFAAAALIVVVLVAATGISTWQARRAMRAKVLARQRLAESQANETLAKQRLAESEAISKFLTEVFQSPDPARKGRTVTVAETLGAAAKKLETDLADQPARQAKLQATLGSTYYALGLYREAIPLQEKVRDYYLAAAGPEHPDTLVAMAVLANSYDGAGRRDEALKLRGEVLALRRKVLGPEHPDTLWAMNNLAISCFEAGRRDEALKLREEVLALRRKVSGPEHPDTLMAMNNLAVSYDAMGRRDEALKLREEVLPLRRKVSGPEHPDTLMAMCNLAISYDAMGRRDEGLKLWEQVLALCRKVSGPEHPDTLGAMGNLANSYFEAGRRAEALKLREQVLALRRKVSGLEHPDTLSAMHNLAVSYAEAGRRDEALKLQEEVLTLRRKVLSPEHPDTLRAMQNLAISYAEAGRRDEALKLREEVLTLSRKVVGPEHPDTLSAIQGLSVSYHQAGRLDEEIKLDEEALPLRRKVSGPENADTLSLMSALADEYGRAGRLDEALRTREELLALRRKVNGPQHPDTSAAMKALADGYFSAGRTREAFALLAKACEVDPKNTDASLALATWQTWSGQDAQYEATRRRLVEEAEATDQDGFHRAAKAYCLRPSTDAALLAKALKLAQRSVELDKDRGDPFWQEGLGMAQYRNGQYAAAERTLTLAEQKAGELKDHQGIVRLFRVMSLVRQGKLEEARKLFSQAEAQMPPFPQEGHQPLAEGRLVNQDYLIWWLAYKEAKALLNGPAATKP